MAGGPQIIFELGLFFCVIKSVTGIDGLWVRPITPVTANIFQAIKEDNGKPILVLQFHSAMWFEILLQQAMDDSEILDKVSWIILLPSPHDITLRQKFKLTPNVRLMVGFTEIEGKRLLNPEIHFGFINEDYQTNVLRYFTLGHWTGSNGLVTLFPFRHCCYNLTGFGLRIVYAENDYPAIRASYVNNQWTFVGTAGDVFTILAKEFDFSLKKVHSVSDGDYGRIYSENNSTGMVQKIVKKEADIALSEFFMTESRVKFVDFSFPYAWDYITAIYRMKKETKYFHLELFFSKNNIWATLLICFTIFMIIVIKALLLSSGEDVEIDALTIWGALLSQAFRDVNISFVGRVLGWSVICMGMACSQSYSSLLASQHIVKTPYKPFQSFHELSQLTEYKPVVLRHSGESELIQNSKDPDMKAIWKRVSSDPDSFTVSSFKELPNKTFYKQAVLISAKRYAAKLGEGAQSMEDEEGPNAKYSVHFLLQKRSPIKRIIDNRLMDLSESGILQKILKKYDIKKEEKLKSVTEANAIQFNEILIFVYIMVSGVILSLVLLLLEKIWGILK